MTEPRHRGDATRGLKEGSMTIKSVLTATALLTVATWLSAGERPNFSGEWVLNKERCTLPATVMVSLSAGSITIDHRDPMFKCRRTFTVWGKAVNNEYDLLSNGVEDERDEPNGKAFLRLVWDGDVLVQTTRVVTPSGEALDTLRYRLQEGGTVLEVAEDYRSPLTNAVNVWIFEKPAPPAATTPAP